MNQNTICLELTEHAIKRLNILIGQEKAQKEVYFMYQYILPGKYNIAWHYGIQLQDITLFADRCNSFDIRILGLETHVEGPFPIHVFAWEDFQNIGNSWVNVAVKNLAALKVSNFIVPSIEIQESTLKEYLF